MDKGLKHILGKVDDITISFHVFVNKKDPYNKNTSDTISDVQFDDKLYTIINTHPYIKLDIRSYEDKKNKEYNNNLSLNLNQYQTLQFVKELNDWYKTVQKESSRIYCKDDNGVLKINTTLANTVYLSQFNFNDKVVVIKPALYEDKSTVDIENPIYYMGCMIAINNYADNVIINLEKVEYLLHILRSTRFPELSLQLLMFNYLHELVLQKEDKPGSNIIPSIADIGNIQSNDEYRYESVPKIMEEKAIPDI